MKSLADQISNKCIHFNGIMSKCCRAGVNYDDFIGADRPFKFPCLKQGGECLLSQFPTNEEVELREAEINSRLTDTLTVHAAIKAHVKKTKQVAGKIPCLCGGQLRYAVAETNGHIRAKCDNCNISFME